MNPDYESYEADDDESRTPFWAYSDDEDLVDVHDELGMSTRDRDDAATWTHGTPDHAEPGEPEDAYPAGEHRPAGTSGRERVQRLLDRPLLSWGTCQQAIKEASAIGAWDLVEEAAVQALRVAHDGDYQVSWSLARVARSVVAARCANASYNDLPGALDQAQAKLRAVAGRAHDKGRTVLGHAVDGEISRADTMLLLLTSPDDARALATLASQLRQIDRPDLAEEASSRGINVDPLNPAPWVTRAASRADRRNHEGALSDLDQDLLVGNIHAAVTRCKVLRAVGRPSEALPIALDAAQRQPSQQTLAMLTVLATELADDHALAEASRLLPMSGDANQGQPPSRLLGLLAAKWLANEGDQPGALRLAEEVASNGPKWHQAENLVTRLKRATPSIPETPPW